MRLKDLTFFRDSHELCIRGQLLPNLNYFLSQKNSSILTDLKEKEDTLNKMHNVTSLPLSLAAVYLSLLAVCNIVYVVFDWLYNMCSVHYVMILSKADLELWAYRLLTTLSNSLHC